LGDAYQVVASRTVNQVLHLRVLADENPLGSSVPVEPGLEDGYMAVMHSATPAMEAVYA
jgi:hypothetical protein